MIGPLLLIALAGQAEGPVYHEGDFAFTEAEQRSCGAEMIILRKAPADQGFRARFINCVLSHRETEKAAAEHSDHLAQYNAADKAFTRTAEETKACSLAAAASRQNLELSLFTSCVEKLRAKKHTNADAIEAAATARARGEATARDPKAAQIILSALLCRAIDDRAGTLNALATDRKYSKIGGAVNLSRRVDLQDELASEDGDIKATRSALAGIGRKALGCKSEVVAALIPCLSDDPGEQPSYCRSPDATVLVSAAALLAPN
jgi:hypothetical protein